MHHHAEVLISSDEDVIEQVREAMAPYYEENEPEGGFWDWYQIGGRWMGAHVSGYDPYEDPQHMATCRWCGGTGRRTDVEPADPEMGCNVCHGDGVELLWATQWDPYPKDVIPVSEIPDDLTCVTLILPDGALQEDGLKEFEGNVKKTLEAKGITEGFLVTVDYHS